MLRARRVVPCLVLFASSLFAAAQQISNPEIERKVDALLGQMTLEEKVGQLTQFAGNNPENIDMIKQGKVGSLLGVLGAQDANEVQRAAVEGSRLKIPLILRYVVVHG